MSNRTDELPPLTGVGRFIRELRYHEASRQGLAVALILFFALTSRPVPLLVAVGMPLAVVGAIVRLYASGFIMKNKELATHGPYALVRHPLYTGNVLSVFGFMIASGNWWTVPVTALFFWFYYPTAIEYEDRKLHKIFGERWEQWSKDVPALVPNLANIGRVGGGSWSLAKSLRQNGEVFIAIFVAVCIWIVFVRLP
jgi:protein-S-isoprenylcysteine O-methyltransferase Ste14